MNHFNKFFKRIEISSPGISGSLSLSASSLVKDHFNFKRGEYSKAGLLFGQVQSGKTSQILAAIALAADNGFPLFILLTSDNIFLHRQTYDRALAQLPTMCICSESDDLLLAKNVGIKPVVVVLKKNYRVLKTWSQHLAVLVKNRSFPLIIIDDEGDAASLNTKVNQKKQSTINRYLQRMRSLFPKTIYLQVTATPQSLILQTLASGWRPEFVHYFEPGENYVGGDFLYAQDSSAIRLIQEGEGAMLSQDSVCPEGLANAIISFLVIGSDRLLVGKSSCSMLVHPSVRIASHEKTAELIGRFARELLGDVEKGSFVIRTLIQNAWSDLKKSYPRIYSFEMIYSNLKTLSKHINILVINSNTPEDIKYDEGLNILVGGNSLGRGLTFKNLQVVYYTRTAKKPQADTCWQHSRMFGYDREPGLCRAYLTPSLMQLFRDLNDANNSLIKALKKENLNDVSLIFPDNINPTRPNVVDKGELNLIVGGVNYFPFAPLKGRSDDLDELLGNSDYEKIISLEEAAAILDQTDSGLYGSWDKDLFCDLIRTLSHSKSSNYSKDCRLIVRVGRDIAKGTGTLLSPDDRSLSASIIDKTVLVMYRLTGGKEKGWDWGPFWVPNIKFPVGACFYKT